MLQIFYIWFWAQKYANTYLKTSNDLYQNVALVLDDFVLQSLCTSHIYNNRLCCNVTTIHELLIVLRCCNWTPIEYRLLKYLIARKQAIGLTEAITSNFTHTSKTLHSDLKHYREFQSNYIICHMPSYVFMPRKSHAAIII